MSDNVIQANFDDELAKLKAGADLMAQIAATNPEIAAQFAAAMEAAQATAEEREQQAQAAAKANAIKMINDSVRQTLSAALAVNPESVVEPGPEPAVEPGPEPAA